MNHEDELMREYSRSQRASLEMRSRFVEATHPFITQYFKALRARLSTRAELKNGPTFVFLTPKKFAFSPGSGVVLISSGLLLSLKNEAELAFVLAHELGHNALGHHSLSEETVKDESKRLEQEADSYGLGAMALSGYDPNAASMALANSYQSLEHLKEGSATHPSLEERMKTMRKAVQASGWQPPGTVYRRDFVKLQHLLS